MSKIEFRISDEKKIKLKAYCTVHNITISKLLINYVDTLVGNTDKSPAKKKNSVKERKYQYCDCGVDLFALSTQDRILHLQNCKNGQNS